MRVMIAEDEPAARRKLARLLVAEAGVVLVAEAENGIQALELATTLRPEVSFLDIQMPGLSGVEVAVQIAPFSLVVFITAFDEHATQAFELNAVDYLLKPYTRDRLRATLARVRQRLFAESTTERQRRLGLALEMIKGPGAPSSDLCYFALHENGRTKPIPLESIRWVAAEDNYCRLYFGAETSLQRLTLTTFIERANGTPGARFVRVHRSSAVNLQHVLDVAALTNSDALITLKCGKQIRLSRRFRQAFFAQMNR